jgi:hypothetical protein
MGFTFVVALLGIALLYVTLSQYEIHAKQARAQLRSLRSQVLAWELQRATDAVPAEPGDSEVPAIVTGVGPSEDIDDAEHRHPSEAMIS